MLDPQAEGSQPLVVAQPAPVREFVRPTYIARARNQVLLGLSWLPVAAAVGVRAFQQPGLPTVWIAVVVAPASVWLAADAVGTRFVDRVVVAHDRVQARLHGTYEIVEFEVTAHNRIEMTYRTEGRRLLRHQYIDLQWPCDGQRRTIRLDVFAKSDQGKILRRLTELTTRR